MSLQSRAVTVSPEVASVVAEAEMDTQLQNLIEQLAQTSPADDIGDSDIQVETDAVRREN